MDNEHIDADDDDAAAPGWEAIDASLAALYGDQEPQHMGTLLNYRLGGPDPLDGISAYRRALPVPHWHYVTYGFSELYDKESDVPDTSGYGFELSFRLLADHDDTTPPAWVFNFLQNLARYVFETGNVFSPGDSMSTNGPIALESATAICAIAFIGDPELPPIDTPNGSLAFIQVVGLTVEERQAAKHWSTQGLLDVLLPHMPLWVTDLQRASLHDVPAIAAEIKAGSARDGSSSGYLHTKALAVQERKRLLRPPVVEIRLGAREAAELGVLLPLRIPFERPVLLGGPEWQLRLEAGSACAVSIAEQVATVTMDAACAQAFATSVLPHEGRYVLDALPQLSWQVQPTLIRDAEGNVVQRIG